MVPCGNNNGVPANSITRYVHAYNTSSSSKLCTCSKEDKGSGGGCTDGVGGGNGGATGAILGSGGNGGCDGKGEGRDM